MLERRLGPWPGAEDPAADRRRGLARPPASDADAGSRAALPTRSRGTIALVEENCTVCMLCARECPDWCLYVEGHTELAPPAKPGGRPRARHVLDRFAIDWSLCLYCGICVEVCPFDALFWAPEAVPDEAVRADLVEERDALRAWVRGCSRRRRSTPAPSRPRRSSRRLASTRSPRSGRAATGPEPGTGRRRPRSCQCRRPGGDRAQLEERPEDRRPAGLLSALILLVGAQFGSGGLLIALVLALGMNGYSYFYSDTLALKSMRAYPVSQVQAPRAVRVVAELAQTMRMPVPRLYVSPTSAPNAFATGRNPQHAAVCCHRGHPRAARRARAAGRARPRAGPRRQPRHPHQLGRGGARHGHHVPGALRPVRRCCSAAAGTTRRAAAASSARCCSWSSDRSPPGSSRWRSAAAASTPPTRRAPRSPATRSALASALRKLEHGTAARPLVDDPRLAPTSSLMIANPFRGRRLGKLFSTHPPMADRIARLEQMAGLR